MTNDILIVDDTPENLRVLGDMLRDCGYKVRAAPSGEIGLKACAARPPDLLLLDVNMPGMNGYEVCDRLKNDPALNGIPVLFISALTDVHHKVQAFESGGLDYITKPFQVEEVAARVATHLRLHRQRLELEADCRRMQRLEESRQHGLAVQDPLHPPVQNPAQLPSSGQVVAPLSEREREIIALLAQGSLYKEIAETLQISPFTVNSYVRRIYEKLGVRSRSQAVAKYRGLIE